MIERIDRLLSKISIQKKIMIIFLGGVLIPLFLQAFFNLTLTEERLQKEIVQRMESTLSQRAVQINLAMGDTLNIALRYNNDERIYRWLEQKYQTNYEYLLTYQDEIKQLTTDLPYHPQVENIIFYTDNETLFDGQMIQKLEDISDPMLGEPLSYHHDDWLDYEEGQLRIRSSVRQAKNETQEERQVSVIRTLNYYPQYRNTEKIVKISLSTAYFNRLLSDTELFESFHLVDENNNILFATKAYNKSGMFEKYDAETLPTGILGLEHKIEGYPFTLCGIYDSKIISAQFQKSRLDTVLIFLLGIGIAAICVTFVGKNISNRTKKIVQQSQEIAKGNFVISKSAQYSKDEIGVVEKSINTLSVQLQDLIEKEYKAQLTQAQMESETNRARLHALQSQVNPHFLFNALESIRMKAQVRNEIETATMIKYMSKMFRHVIDWTDEVVLLSEDIGFLNEFLSIQKYRFGDTFEYYIHVDEGAENVLLPKMIIQPLVENACIHGAQSVSGICIVVLRIMLQEENLVVHVEDNGGGITEKRMEEIREIIKQGETSGKNVGITNVYQRLKLYYGDEFAFDMDSETGKGTHCIVSIPLKGISLPDIG